MVAYRSLYLVLTMLLSGSVFTYPLQGSSAPQSLSLSRRSTPGNGAGLPDALAGPSAPRTTGKSPEELERDPEHLRKMVNEHMQMAIKLTDEGHDPVSARENWDKYMSYTRQLAAIKPWFCYESFQL